MTISACSGTASHRPRPARRWAWATVMVAGVLACDGGPPPDTATPPVTNAPVPAAPESDQDAVVARVNGLPIFASCVAHQASGAPGPRGDAGADLRRALDDCIGFELLAQQAAARGLATHPEVLAATKTAQVSRLVELELEAKVRSPSDLPASFSARILDRSRWRMHRVDYRASFFVRFPVAKGEPADGPVDRAARAAAERVAAALADQRGLFADHVSAIAKEAAGGVAMEEGNVDLSDMPRLVPTYADALFAIPEIGRTSGAIRTDWGWDVILWTKELPPRDISADELALELFPEMRLAYFVAWSKALGKDVRVQIFPDAVARLDTSAASPATSVPTEGGR